MFNKVKEYFEKKQTESKKRDELLKAQAYYRVVKAGQTFIQFVQEDIKNQEQHVNRAQRRRMEKDLNEKGVLSPELVEYYSTRLDWVLHNINVRLNPPKVDTRQNSNIQVQTEKPTDA